MTAVHTKPKIIAVREKPVKEREPPSEKTHRFLYVRRPGK